MCARVFVYMYNSLAKNRGRNINYKKNGDVKIFKVSNSSKIITAMRNVMITKIIIVLMIMMMGKNDKLFANDNNDNGNINVDNYSGNHPKTNNYHGTPNYIANQHHTLIKRHHSPVYNIRLSFRSTNNTQGVYMINSGHPSRLFGRAMYFMMNVTRSDK